MEILVDWIVDRKVWMGLQRLGRGVRWWEVDMCNSFWSEFRQIFDYFEIGMLLKYKKKNAGNRKI